MTGSGPLDNIRRLWPGPKISDETRYSFGFRLGGFRYNGDQLSAYT